MMRYATQQLNATAFVAKIGDDNAPSLRLFERLSFQVTTHSNVFQETTMQLTVSSQIESQLRDHPCSFDVYETDNSL